VSISFIERPAPDGFGVFVGPNDGETSGYVVYRLDGGAATALPTPTLIFPGANTFFAPIATRVYGRGYFAEALDVMGRRTGVYSPVIVDRFNEPTLFSDYRWDLGRDGDLSDSAPVGEGSAQRSPDENDFTFVNRAPVKFSAVDPDTNLLGDGAGGPGGSGNADGAGTWTQSGTTRII
jgi:hypothetical protein